MSMIERLLLDYLRAEKLKVYEDCDTLENICTYGEWVFWEEVSVCGYYRAVHELKILDILAWVYSKQINP